MADDKNNVIFGAEFEGQGIKAGVDDILNSLEAAEKAQALLKQATKETTEELKKNRKELEANAKALKTSLDPKRVEELTKKQNDLNATYDDLIDQQADLAVAYKKTSQVIKDYNKVQNDSAKDNDKVSKAAAKLTNVNEIAADGIKKFGNFAKDAAFGLVSGFAGGIVAQALPAIIKFAQELFSAGGAMSELQKDTALYTEIQGKAAEGYSKDLARLELLRGEINNHNNTNKQRIALIKEYNKTAEEGNRISETDLNNTNAVNAAIDRQIQLIKQRAIAKAAENVIAEKAEELVKLQLEREERFPQQSDAELKALNNALQKRVDERAKILKLGKVDANEILAFADLPEDQLKELAKKNQRLEILLDNQTRIQIKSLGDRIKLIDQYRKGETGLSAGIAGLTDRIEKAQAEFDRALRVGLSLITPESLLTKTTAKTIENVFAQKLAELKAKLASVAATGFQSEGLIREKFAAQLDKEFLEIGRLLKEKKLTIPQADILKGLLKQINEVELSKSLEDFRKKVAEALRRVNDEISTLNIEAETKRINNIRDEFEKEKQLIEQNFQATIAQITARQDAFRKKIDEDSKAGLISPEVAKRKKMIAFFLFGGLTDQAEQAKLNAELDLAFKVFLDTLDRGKKEFEARILEDNQETTKAIREQVALFLEGKISYEKYQKNLTEIIKKESRDRRRVQLDEAEFALDLINKQLAATTDPAQLKALQAQRDALLQQISALKREIATGAADSQNADEKKRIDQLLAYVNAVNQLATAVLQFWQQVNQAEAQALDRSIALQNRRVENAREIADKGNAEYLEMEQKRLDELERKREANARRQIAINNALVASQAIVAAISAIAQAVQTGSPLAAIAAVAAVIGAIGAAYSFVNSLQPQDANFYKGTEYVEGPAGRDKVKANLTRGERVTTASDNEKYWDTLQAIHNHTIPAEDLNRFVESYPNSGIPMVDFDRLSVATDGKLGADSQELLGRVDRLNGTMEQVVVGLNELGINVNLDERGFEASISKARKTRLRKYRS